MNLVKEIPLTQGYVALVDDEDFARLAGYHWCAYVSEPHDTVYAQATVKVEGEWTSVFMHRVIFDLKDSKIQVDHRNHNGLNNQRYNLRVCTSTQNHGNMRKTRGTSRYKGVSWYKQYRKWVAEIMINRRGKYLGSFHVEEDAARAYDRAAREYFGEFALTNFSSPLAEESSSPLVLLS